MNLFFFLCNIVLVVFMGVMFVITPMLNRRSLLFGVRIPESAVADPACRQLTISYIKIMSLGCLLVLVLSVAQFVAKPQLSLLALLYFPLIMIGVQFAAFIPQWRKALILKQEKGWHVPLTASMETRSAAERQKLSTLPWWWYIVSGLLILAAAIWTISLYPSLPDNMITHWDINMQPNAWANKNLLSLMGIPLISLGIVAMMAAANILVYKQKLQISAEYPALSFTQHRLYRRMMSHGLGFLTLCMTLMFVLIQPVSLNLFTPSPVYMPTVLLLATLIGMIPIIYVSIKAGQSGCKLKPTISLEDELNGQLSEKVKIAHPGRADDKYWKLGMFYCNPDDPAVLIENRFGGNGGFNYSRLPTKLFVIILAVVLVCSYIFITYQSFMAPLV